MPYERGLTLYVDYYRRTTALADTRSHATDSGEDTTGQ